jgi:hypothetical protein
LLYVVNTLLIAQVLGAWAVVFGAGLPSPAPSVSGASAASAAAAAVRLASDESAIMMIPYGLRNAILELSVLTLDVWQTLDAGCFMSHGHGMSLVVAVAMPAWLVMLVVLVFGLAYLQVDVVEQQRTSASAGAAAATEEEEETADHRLDAALNRSVSGGCLCGLHYLKLAGEMPWLIVLMSCCLLRSCIHSFIR